LTAQQDSTKSASASRPLLAARGLTVSFPVKTGILRRTVASLTAVDGVDLDIIEGETLGLIGESGSGKSTLGRALLRLVEPTGGQVILDGTDVCALAPHALKPVRRQAQLIFQDAAGSLNPLMTVRQIIGAGLRAHGARDQAERDARVAEVLKAVGLDADAGRRYPHEFSGGQRQRIGIARALVLRPRLIIADEPVSALDVSIQAQVLKLLVELKQEFRLTYLFIGHDLAVVDCISDRVAVMYLGKIVEVGSAAEVRDRPQHPYTRALLSAHRPPALGQRGQRVVLAGEPPNPMAPPSGCRFRTRCPLAQDICAEQEPLLEPRGTGHMAACHFSHLVGGPAEPLRVSL